MVEYTKKLLNCIFYKGKFCGMIILINELKLNIINIFKKKKKNLREEIIYKIILEGTYV